MDRELEAVPTESDEHFVDWLSKTEPQWWTPGDFDKVLRLARLGAAAEGMAEALEGALADIDDLVAESSGVWGLHLNGENAAWVDLLDGGNLCEWTSKITESRTALTNYRRMRDGK